MCYDLESEISDDRLETMAARENTIFDVSNINEKVYLLLKERLIDLTYPPGSRINVSRLQNELGISYTPIKDAFFRLAGEGLVEVSSRRGTFVKPLSIQDILDTIEARVILECGCIDLVAPNINEQQLAELEQLYKATLKENCGHDYCLFLKMDGLFHLAIIRFTGNKRMLKVYELINTHVQIARSRFAPSNQQRFSDTDRQHGRIFEAIQNHDAEDAKAALIEHLSSVRDFFLASDAISDPDQNPNPIDNR